MLPPVVGGGLSILFNESLGFLPAEHLRHIKFLAGRWGRCHLKGGKVDRKNNMAMGSQAKTDVLKVNHLYNFYFDNGIVLAMGNHL